jgi:AraC-like DNA-binding protein
MTVFRYCKTEKEIKKIIVSIIKLNYRDPNFNVSRLSSILRTSNSHLREIIKDHYNISPHKLIENIRLEHAVNYLSINIDIFHVSKYIGYSNSRTFRVAFKSRLGIAPSLMKKEFFENEMKQDIVDKYLKTIWKV